MAGLSLPLAAQSSETGEGPEATAPRAQPAGDLGDPGASQDAEAAREKLLKAADQLDNIETNAESTKAAVDGMKSDLAKLSDENTALKAQVSTLQDMVTKQQDELDKIEAEREKERQALIDEVASLVAEKTAPHHARTAAAADDDTPAPQRHADDDGIAAAPAKTHDASLSPPPDASGPTRSDASGSNAPDASGSLDTGPVVASADATPAPPPATPRPHKGYYHVVEAHETLSLICEAYRDHGVNVTVAQIRRANGLTSRSELKVGQKLFIPKPGT